MKLFVDAAILLLCIAAVDSALMLYPKQISMTNSQNVPSFSTMNDEEVKLADAQRQDESVPHAERNLVDNVEHLKSQLAPPKRLDRHSSFIGNRRHLKSVELPPSPQSSSETSETSESSETSETSETPESSETSSAEPETTEPK